jgi:hypothetical protein
MLDTHTTQRVELREGAVAARVAHVESGHRFVVMTPDAEVEVRGTTFRVTVVPPLEACADGGRTRVVVTEGTVVVRARGTESYVSAGNSWPAPCARAAAIGTQKVAPPIAVSAPPMSASSLSAQNDLFADAMTAKRNGDARRAVSILDELVTSYPHGPLVESAEAERLRVLRELDPARARVEANGYLVRYPNGFARDEARAILSP